jgi:DNA repair protein REV1
MIHIITQEWFGVATGEMLHNFSQGLDVTQLESVPDRKSIGVEVNWGIRFTDKSKAMRFFTFVCAELASRIDQVLYVSHTTYLYSLP